jgi:CheY-like chemotaxis protein
MAVDHVESAPGQGSRFEILPPFSIRRRRRTRDSTVTPAKEPGTVAGTVLINEDEQDTSPRRFEDAAKSRVAPAIEAGDGTMGANLFRANERLIDVVLLDMALPGMSGREVLEELR